MNFTKKQMALAVGLALSAAATPAMADKYWVCSSGDWSNSACWSNASGGAGGAGVPGAGEAVFNKATTRYLTSSGYDWASYNSDMYYSSTSPQIGSLTVAGYHYSPFFSSQDNYYKALLYITNNAVMQVTNNVVIGNAWGGNDSIVQHSGQLNVGGSLILADASSANQARYLLNGGSVSAANETIGSSGYGTFAQYGSTSNSVSNILWIGANAGSVGQYYSYGATLNTGDLHVGSSGTGTFYQSGGTTTVRNNLWIAAYAGANGTYTQAAGAHNVGNLAYIATQSGSTGTYNLQGGSFSSNLLVLGRHTGANGTFKQTGGTNFADRLVVGLEGNGIYNHSAGNNTVSGTRYSDSGTLIVGDSIGGTGTYNLSGTGSLTAKYVHLGLYGGSGTFNQYGGTHNVGHSMWIGTNSGANGTYYLSGGALNTGDLHVGSAGTGAFTQQVGSSANTISNNLYVGVYSGGSGTYTQYGGTTSVANALHLGLNSGASGSYNLNGGTLSVGNIVRGAGSSAFNFNAGALSITGAGGLNVGSGPLGNNVSLNTGKWLSVTNALTINAGSNVNVIGGLLQAANVTNNGTLSSNSSLNVGSGLANNGALGLSGGTVSGNINNAGTVAISNTVNHTGTLTQTAGTTTINGTLNTGGMDIQGGMLNGSGNITGSVLNSAGTVAVGNSPGSMTINGNFTQSLAGIFDVELGGLIAGSQYDTLNITGTANLDGTLNVSLFDLGSGLFNPHQGDTFDILSAEHLNGSFGSLLLAPLDAGLKWNIAYLIDANGTTDVVRLSVQSVPVPAAVWLLGSGLLGLAGIARRK